MRDHKYGLGTSNLSIFLVLMTVVFAFVLDKAFDRYSLMWWLCVVTYLVIIAAIDLAVTNQRRRRQRNQEQHRHK
ncbi:hypothetical protein [Lacticaseibacillus thailandensis]|uniref:hypothetical protein n=1 Tax=Lacticaseibacillus thailandensis TaxID=381741 RepID=UPI0006CF6106|nr:hypothetical protein [Lacticaseibacillus thailandensis]